MTRIIAVIFDMDGLLLDSERMALAAFREACSDFGLGDRTDLFIKSVGLTPAAGEVVIQQGIGGRADHKAFIRCWEEKYHHTTANGIPLKSGVHSLLAFLAENNIPAGVATSTIHTIALKKLEAAGILDCFQTIVGGDQVQKSKPHPEIYLTASVRLDVKPGNCLALEDSENGVRAAVAAGMQVVQVPDLIPPTDALMRLGHRVMDSLEEVVAFLKNVT